MKEVSTVAEHKINTRKSVIFLHTSNEHMEMKLKINSIIASKRIKNLRIHLIKKHRTSLKTTKH